MWSMKKFTLKWFPAVRHVALFWSQGAQNVYIVNDIYHDASVIVI